MNSPRNSAPIARPSTAGCAEASSRAAWRRSAPNASGSSPPLRPQHEPAIESRHDNTIEGVWRNLKRHHLAHQTFTGPYDLDCAIQDAVMKLNTERNRHPLANHRIAA